MSRVFAITLALSTAAHLAAVGFGRPTAPSQPAGNTVVALTLIPPATQPATPTVTTPTLPSAPRQHAAHSAVAPHPSAATDAARASRPTAAIAIPGATASTPSDALVQQVQALLSGRFHYPRLARTRGWEGIVEIALNLAPDGRITQVHLHRASGHAVLDNAAMDSAQQLRAVPNVATLLQGRAREMIIPVHYRLRES
ncbi:MAG: energy transducer TonB [Gammaproteobacteria bacterium]|nr:energy transducer TonB [Gammaproteobacteria bacterium]